MEAAAVDAVLDGLKRSGVDFVSLMPDSDFSVLQARVADDPHFTYVPVSNEAIGVGVCAGRMAERKTACVIGTDAQACSWRHGRSRVSVWHGVYRCFC